jgi:hypothetical protein
MERDARDGYAMVNHEKFELCRSTILYVSVWKVHERGSETRAFSKLFGGLVDGTRQAAVYGNPAQGNYTLHSKEAGRGPSAAFDFHFDIYNPLSGPIGLVGHLFGDVIGGHNGTPCLDPAWNQQ